MKEEVDLIQGNFYLAVEGKKVKLVLDEPLPKAFAIAMRGKPVTVSERSATTTINWQHKIPVQKQKHVKENKVKASELIDKVLEGTSPRDLINESLKGWPWPPKGNRTPR